MKKVYSLPEQKTVFLMVLTAHSTIFEALRPQLEEVSKDCANRAKYIDKYTQECFDYCTTMGNFKLSVRAEKTVDGFAMMFGHLIEKLPLNNALSAFEAANVLLADACAFVQGLRTIPCYMRLRKHADAITEKHLDDDGHWESHGCLYMVMAPYLSPDRHEEIWVRRNK